MLIILLQILFLDEIPNYLGLLTLSRLNKLPLQGFSQTYLLFASGVDRSTLVPLQATVVQHELAPGGTALLGFVQRR